VELEVVQRSRVGAMLIFVLLLFWRRGRLLVGGYADGNTQAFYSGELEAPVHISGV
jgi:hypothetical protein